jgi:hypothetical protein
VQPPSGPQTEFSPVSAVLSRLTFMEPWVTSIEQNVDEGALAAIAAGTAAPSAAGRLISPIRVVVLGAGTGVAVFFNTPGVSTAQQEPSIDSAR